MVGRPFGRFGSGREALPQVWACSGGPPGGLVVVVRPSHRFGSGRQALSEVQEWSVGPPKGPGVVRSGLKALP